MYITFLIVSVANVWMSRTKSRCQSIDTEIKIVFLLKRYIDRVCVLVYHFNIATILIYDGDGGTLSFVIVTAFPVLFAITLSIPEESYAVDDE